MRKLILAALAAATLSTGAVALSAAPAGAHQWGGVGSAPAHTHAPGSCVANIPFITDQSNIKSGTCVRYILANGAIVQGRYDYMLSQYGYVLVWCSFKTKGAAGNVWLPAGEPFGPWGNNNQHPYCNSPVYGGKAWPFTLP